MPLISSILVRKTSLYQSEPRLSNIFNSNNRNYSSMTSIQRLKNVPSINNDISYEVDSPRSSYGYLNAFLLKKQQQRNQSATPISTFRPKSVPISDSSIFHNPIRPKSTTFANETSINQISNSRINIGITLDSRLRKTPVFDMLRSTMMESQHSNKTYSFPLVARF